LVPARVFWTWAVAPGAFGARLEEAGNTVTGVEVDTEHAEVARSRIRVLEGDFLDIDIDGSFDIVLFGDVLEHLRYPALALAKARTLAHQTIVCVPNFEMFAVRLLRMAGVSKMRTGILDATHIYPFSKHTIERMLDATGWRVRDHASPAPKKFPQWYNGLIRRSPTFFGYQFLYRCEPGSDNQ
jgi:2-polyprenyl-3-methyl-5-hydroxy-6-metoxy-1,4-benzoquinol methylase